MIFQKQGCCIPETIPNRELFLIHSCLSSKLRSFSLLLLLPHCQKSNCTNTDFCKMKNRGLEFSCEMMNITHALQWYSLSFLSQLLFLGYCLQDSTGLITRQVLFKQIQMQKAELEIFFFSNINWVRSDIVSSCFEPVESDPICCQDDIWIDESAL